MADKAQLRRQVARLKAERDAAVQKADALETLVVQTLQLAAGPSGPGPVVMAQAQALQLAQFAFDYLANGLKKARVADGRAA